MWRIRSGACGLHRASGAPASSAHAPIASFYSVARAAHSTAARACLPCVLATVSLRPAATPASSSSSSSLAPSRGWGSRSRSDDGWPDRQWPDRRQWAPGPDARAEWRRDRSWSKRPTPDLARRLRRMIADLHWGRMDNRELHRLIRDIWGDQTRVASLSHATAQRALVTCYMLECLPNELDASTGQPSVAALPTDSRALMGPPLPATDSTLYPMLVGQIRDADRIMTTYKSAPAGATHHHGDLVPTGEQVRCTAVALVVLLRALGDSGLFAYMRWSGQCPNDRRQQSSGADGYISGYRSWNRLDAVVFPHLALEGTRARFAPRLLCDAQEVVRKHLDLLLWPPPAGDDAQLSDPSMSATETVAQAQREWDQVLAANPSFPSVVSLSYPHASPARNLVTLVSLFQTMRGTLSSTDLVTELLRLMCADWTEEVDRLRAQRPFHFLDTLKGMYVARRDRAAAGAGRNTEEENHQMEASEADGEFDAAADAAEAADSPAASTLPTEADAETGEAEMAGRVDGKATPTTQAGEKLEQPSSEPAQPSFSSSTAAVADSVPFARPLPPRLHTLLGSLNPAEMLVLVEAWAAHNCVSRCRHFCSAIESYLHEHRRTSFRQLSLSQLHRWMLCISAMELMMPVSESLLCAMSRFMSGRNVVRTPLGEPQPALRIPARWFEHCSGPDKVEQATALITAQLRKSGSANEPFSRPPDRAPALLLGNVLSSMLCAYGPIAVKEDDVLSQIHMPAEKRSRLLSQMHVLPTSLVAVVRATCDYLTAVMRDESIMEEHVAVYRHRATMQSPDAAWQSQTASAWDAAPPSRIPPPPHPARLVLVELTNVAWSLVLMRMDHFAFVHHFLAAYLRWFGANFTLREKTPDEAYPGAGGVGVDVSAGVFYRGEELDFPRGSWTLTRRMHQVALQLFLRSTMSHSRLSTRFMPAADVLQPSPLPPPASLNFSSDTRDLLMRLVRGGADALPLSVSSLQLQVYHLMRDPDGPMHFRQRVLHSNFALHMSNETRNDLMQRERMLNLAEAEAAQAAAAAANASADADAHSSFGSASSEALGALLSDGLDPASARTELTHAHGAVDLFVEHRTTLGYVIDAALFMRTRDMSSAHSNPVIAHLHRPFAPTSPSLLTSLPAVRSALAAAAAAASPSAERSPPPPAFRTTSVALEVDGSYHFCASTRYYLNADSRLKQRQLRAFGWFVLHVPYFEWNRLADPDEQSQWLAAHLPRSMLKKEREQNREYKEALARLQQEEQQALAAEQIRRAQRKGQP